MSLLEVILPIVLIVGAGAALGRGTAVDTRSLSRVTVYLLTPSLVFTALVRTDLDAVGGYRLAALAAVHFGLLVLLGAATARLLRLPRVDASGLVLSTALYNAGNYGLPVSLFAFGQEGMRLAAVIFVVSALAAHSAGIYIASAGRNAPRRALADIFRLPLVYAVLLALAIQALDWTVPPVLWRPVELMGQGAIPMLLIALGVQVAQSRPALVDARLGAIGGLRLVLSPLLAAVLAPWFGVTGTAARVAVLSASMPTAVNAFLLAVQFDAAPALVAGAVFATTIVSFGTVAVVLTLLQ